VNGLASDSIDPRAASMAAVRFSIDPPNRTITLSSGIFCQFSAEDAAMQALDLFRFSKHLRTSGQFTLEQADALTEALAAAIINLEDHKIDYQEPARTPEHNKPTAVLLAIFLGGLGAHKFYLGHAAAGILYLIFCWTFIPALLGFIEGLRYLSYSRDEFMEEYG
jgi:TM2 domain-containing membrane protein YozV